MSSSWLATLHFCTTQYYELRGSSRTGVSTCQDGWAGHRQGTGRVGPTQVSTQQANLPTVPSWAGPASASLRAIRKLKSR